MWVFILVSSFFSTHAEARRLQSLLVASIFSHIVCGHIHRFRKHNSNSQDWESHPLQKDELFLQLIKYIAVTVIIAHTKIGSYSSRIIHHSYIFRSYSQAPLNLGFPTLTFITVKICKFLPSLWESHESGGYTISLRQSSQFQQSSRSSLHSISNAATVFNMHRN